MSEREIESPGAVLDKALKVLTSGLRKELGAEESLVYASPEKAMRDLHSILRKLEEEGVCKINWENLALYVPDSAKALVAMTFEQKNQLYVLGGKRSPDQKACMAIGVPVVKGGSLVRYHCSCTLVGPRHVLTARHGVESEKCWKTAEQQKGDPEFYVSPKTDLEPSGHWYPAEVVWCGKDERASGGAARNDLAVLEVDFRGFRVPKAPGLAPPELFGRRKVARLVAYGPVGGERATNGIRRLGMVAPIWESRVIRRGDGMVSFDPQTEFVCGPGGMGQDGVSGDSGGGVFLEDEDSGEWLLAGVLSRGAGLTNRLGAGAVYTKAKTA